MLILLFCFFLVVALITIGLSVYVREPYYALIGFFFLFYISVALMTDGLEYKTGLTETEVHDTFTHYHYINETVDNPSQTPDNYLHNSTVTGNVTTTTVYNYTTYDNNYTWWFGFLLAITSAFSFAFVMYDLRKDRGFKKDIETGEAP